MLDFDFDFLFHISTSIYFDNAKIRLPNYRDVIDTAVVIVEAEVALFSSPLSLKVS